MPVLPIVLIGSVIPSLPAVLDNLRPNVHSRAHLRRANMASGLPEELSAAQNLILLVNFW